MKRRSGVYSLTKLDIYNYYKKNRKSLGLSVLDKHLFYNIMEEFNKEISKEIIEGYVFKLPEALGYLGIDKRKRRYKKTVVDWKTTKQLWEESIEDKENKTKVFIFNEHSDGYIMKWKWSRTNKHIKYRNHYDFIPTRANKRNLAKQIKATNTDYYDKIY